MTVYVPPEVLITYSVEKLVEEAAVCASYGVPVDTPPTRGNQS